MTPLVSGESFLVALLFIASIATVISRALRVPYTLLLVIVGLAVALVQPEQRPDLVPDLILTVFLPPLVFEAGYHFDLKPLRANLMPVFVLAVPGVIVTTLVVGGVIDLVSPVALTTALLFGAIVSSTDAVAVSSLFSKLGAPRKLVAIVQGESLFNDGTSIVLFNVLLAVALTGSLTTLQRGVVGDLLLIGWVSVAGLVIGASFGLMAAIITQRLDDYLLTATLTAVLAFGSYLIADALQVSGVFAVATAALVFRNYRPEGVSPTTRIVLGNLWEFIAFIANSLVFLLIGLSVSLSVLVQFLPLVLIAIGAVIFSRAVTVYGFSFLLNLRNLKSPKLPLQYQHVLFWSAVRGAVGLALALSLPDSLPQRQAIQAMTFGVVLFTLLVQGPTVAPLLRRLKLVNIDEDREEYERRFGRLMAIQAARNHLGKLHGSGIFSESTWQRVSADLDAQLQIARAAVDELLNGHPELQASEMDRAKREGHEARRAGLDVLLRNGVLSQRTYDELVREVDAAQDAAQDAPLHAQKLIQNPGLPEVKKEMQ
jgi:CPA1 family monovalent cation:H+ antiporter